MSADELEACLKQLSSFFYIIRNRSAIFVIIFKLN
jgi:hypothetical protein